MTAKKRAEILLPELAGTACAMLGVCANIHKEPEGPARDLPKPGTLIARYGTGRGSTYLRAIIVGEAADTLHVDCALGSAFSKTSRPKATHRVSDVLKTIGMFDGLKASAIVTGHFSAPSDFLRKSRLGSLLGLDTDGTPGVRLVQGTLVFEDTALKELGWAVDRETNDGWVTMTAAREIVFGADSLAASLRWITLLLDTLMRSTEATDAGS